MIALDPWLKAAGRGLLSIIFIVSGAGKIGAYSGTQDYMAGAGLPGELLPAVIAAELGGGLALLAGFLTRWAALGLAAFTVVAALVFHMDFADRNQMIHFMKNLAMTGGLLAVAAAGPGALAFDSRR